MITGDIHHLEAYEKQLPPFISQCLRAVRDFDFASVPDGTFGVHHVCGVSRYGTGGRQKAGGT